MSRFKNSFETFAKPKKFLYTISMFNWFRNSQKKLIPEDLDSAFLTSKFIEVKLGCSLTLPTNSVCFVSFKDKIYCTAEKNLEITESNLQKLIEKQTKKQEKSIKNVKMDLFFVNLNEMEKSFSYKDKLNFSGSIVKVLINVNIKTQIINYKKFLSFVLSNLALPNGNDTDNLIFGYLEDDLRAFFLRKKLNDEELTYEMKSALQQKAQSFFKSIGIDLSSIDLKISFNDKSLDLSNRKTRFDFSKSEESENSQIFTPPFKDEESEVQQSSLIKDETQLQKSVDEENVKIYNEKSESSSSRPKTADSAPEIKHCPVCGIKLILGAKYCHRCGNRNF